VLAALVAAAGFLRARAGAPVAPAAGKPAASAGEAMRTATFWLLAVASSLGSATVIGVTVHVVAWQTGRGVPPETAALVLSVLFVSSMAGAFLAGYAADRARSVHVLQIFYALPLFGLGLMAASVAVPALVVGAVLIGIAMGATTGLAPFLATRYFGLKASAEIFGIMMAMTMVALGLVPLLIGIGFDATGGYTWPLSLAAVILAISTICVGLLDYSARFWRQTHGITAAGALTEE
jgi:MFS family permease